MSETLLDPASPKAALAAGLARELLTARLAGQAGGLTDDVFLRVLSACTDVEVLSYLLVAQTTISALLLVEVSEMAADQGIALPPQDAFSRLACSLVANNITI